jgi:hypothetical protein
MALTTLVCATAQACEMQLAVFLQCFGYLLKTKICEMISGRMTDLLVLTAFSARHLCDNCSSDNCWCTS